MILEENEVIELIKAGTPESILEARIYSDLLNMHVTGKDIKKYTEQFNNHESAAQKTLREKLIKSNKSLFSFILRPLDKIFTAKGGAINYNLPENKVEILRDAVSDVTDGLDIKTYLKKIVKSNYIIDPNGFIMVDLDNEGALTTKMYPTKDIFHYYNRGNEVQSIIFNPYESGTKEDKKLYYRVLDDTTDRIFIQDGDVVYLDEESILDNYFGYVPARILGDIVCPNTGRFLSLIDDVIEDANEHLRDVSVNIVHKLSHGYAKYWQYPESCTTCGGDGIVLREVDNVITEVVCHTCLGNKTKDHKDASDLMILDIPREGEHILAPNVAGYINPSMEVWKQYKEDIADLKTDMFQSIWGTTYTTEGKNETATGRMLNVQPEAERVTWISKTFSSIHNFVLDCYGKVILSNKNYQSNVSYGTRYLMESPDAILNTLRDAKKDGLPTLIQKNLTYKYYQTEYQNNNEEYQKISKVLSVDPFPSMSAQEVKDLGITGDELLKKIYYPQWVNQLEEAKQLLMTTEQLKEDLNDYVLKLNVKLKQDEVQQRNLDSTA